MNSKSGAVLVGEREVTDARSLAHSRVPYQEVELRTFDDDGHENGANMTDAMGSVPMDVRDMQRMGKEQVGLYHPCCQSQLLTENRN